MADVGPVRLPTCNKLIKMLWDVNIRYRIIIKINNETWVFFTTGTVFVYIYYIFLRVTIVYERWIEEEKEIFLIFIRVQILVWCMNLLYIFIFKMLDFNNSTSPDSRRY